jgi:DNA-binding response OmpR family regulator
MAPGLAPPFLSIKPDNSSILRMKMRLLIVEDFEPLRKTLVKGLQEAGYAVDSSAEGEDGLWMATSNKYDLVILDLMLPGLSGLEILKGIRDKGLSYPVLILTAKESVEDKVAGLDSGADDYIVKPFDFVELLARVRSLIRRSYDKQNPEVEVGPLKVNTNSKKVSVDDEEIELTAREYFLLEYLLQRRGEKVTRMEIWEHIYDANADQSSNTVDVYVGYLRKKLKNKENIELIHTYRGVGYGIKEA